MLLEAFPDMTKKELMRGLIIQATPLFIFKATKPE